jgi:hypothetical protein
MSWPGRRRPDFRGTDPEGLCPPVVTSGRELSPFRPGVPGMTDAIVVEWLVKRFGTTTVVRILTSSRPLSRHPGSLAVGVLFALQRSCRTPTARAAPLKRQDGRR